MSALGHKANIFGLGLESYGLGLAAQRLGLATQGLGLVERNVIFFNSSL